MEKLLSFSTLLLSFCTVSGVMIHSTHLSQVTGGSHIMRTNTSDSGTGHASVDNNTHPHAEFQNSTLFRYLGGTSANYPAERAKYKKYLMQNQAPRGRHAFDNHFLPIVG